MKSGENTRRNWWRRAVISGNLLCHTRSTSWCRWAKRLFCAASLCTRTKWRWAMAHQYFRMFHRRKRSKSWSTEWSFAMIASVLLKGKRNCLGEYINIASYNKTNKMIISDIIWNFQRIFSKTPKAGKSSRNTMRKLKSIGAIGTRRVSGEQNSSKLRNAIDSRGMKPTSIIFSTTMKWWRSWRMSWSRLK